MTTIRTAAVALVALVSLLLGSAIANGAAGVKIVNFSAKYNGTATVKVTGEVVDSIAAKGTGTGVPIGKGTITGLGKGEAKQQPCNNWGGTGVLKGTKGTITFKMLPAPRVRRRGRQLLQHRRPGRRHEGHRQARQGKREPEGDGELRPRRGHVHREVHGEAQAVTRFVPDRAKSLKGGRQ